MQHIPHFTHDELMKRGFLPTPAIARSRQTFAPIGVCTEYEYLRLPSSIKQRYTINPSKSRGAYMFVRKQEHMTPEYEFA